MNNPGDSKRAQGPESPLYAIVDFIFQASPEEIKAIEFALEKRKSLGHQGEPPYRQPGQAPPPGAAPRAGGGAPGAGPGASRLDKLNPFNMAGSGDNFAKETAQKLMQNMGLGDNPKDMARRVVRQMLSNYLPPIPPDHIEVLIQNFLGEQELPNPDMLTFMVASFLDYSTGVMPAETEQLLRTRLPDWPDHFWKNFPPALQTDIKEAIKQKKNGSDILRNIRSYYPATEG